MRIKAENLAICRGSPYFRIIIPKDLRLRFERREFRRRIPDCALRDAFSIAKFLRDKFQALFRSARKGMLSDEQIKKLANFHLDASLSGDDSARLDEGPKDQRQIDAELKLAKQLLAISKTKLAANDLSSASGDAETLLRVCELAPENNSRSFKKLCLELLRKNVQRFEIEMKRIAGEHAELPDFSANCQSPYGISAVPNAKPHKKLKELLDRYIGEKKAASAWKEKSERSFTAALVMMLSHFGDCPVQSISHEMMFDFRDNILVKLPANQAKRKELKGKSLEEIAQAEGLERMSIRTVNEKLSTMASFLSWCQKHGYVSVNPGSGLLLKESRRASEERSSYSKEDLEKILTSIAGMRDGEHPENYWIPLIAMYSGMRQGEIAQLYIEDIRQLDGIWIFDINESAEDKSVKTKASTRQVPLHPELIKLGLLGYREKEIQRNAKRMWPELEFKRDGYGQTFQRWYGRFNRQIITENPKKSFHSFRHTFIDYFKQKLVNEGVIKAIVGHEDDSITTGRYGKSFKMEILFDAIKTLDYGLNIPALLNLKMKAAIAEKSSKG